MHRFLASVMLVLVTQASAQIIDPQVMDLDAFGAEYLPVIREFDALSDAGADIIRTIDSPHLTRKITIVEESDLTQTTVEASFAKVLVSEEDEPRLTIEISRYRRFSISWINEELIHVANWPGRCVELHTLYSLAEKQIVYERGFNHCGV